MTWLTTVFWGVFVISLLVFIHEGGHYVAARLCGVRVTEFSLGLRSKLALSRISRRRGTKLCVTAVPLGGYVMISGMSFPAYNPDLELVLALVNARGQASISEIARVLDGSVERAHTAVSTLVSWGSLMGLDDQGYEVTFDDVQLSHVATMMRDAQGHTIYDVPRERLEQAGANKVGDPYVSELTPAELLSFDRRHTYHGLNVVQRLFVLIAGVTVNVVFAVIIFLGVFCLLGVPVSTNTIDRVEEHSQAADVGIVPGDTIVRIGDDSIQSFSDVVSGLNKHHDGKSFEIEMIPAGTQSSQMITATFPVDQEIFGVSPVMQNTTMTPREALRATASYLVTSAQGILNLFNPWRVKQTLDSSVSIIGIASLTKEAADTGLQPFLMILGGISLSLGLINLLPIPPLDGGKIVLEIVGGVRGKEVGLGVQQKLSLVGVALLILLFLYMIFQDIVRFIL